MISQTLYRYLDAKVRDGKTVFRQSLRDLAYQHLGLSRDYFPSQIKRKLAPAHEELIYAFYDKFIPRDVCSGASFDCSGTAIMAAQKTGRVCCAMELDPRYVEAAVRRWEAYTGGTARRL